MKAAIYTRVSTDHQSDNLQLDSLREHCKRQGWHNAREYSDTISGSKSTRPALNRLLQDIRNGKIDVVLVYKLDRIGRSLPHLIQLFQEFKNNKVQFIALSQGISTVGDNPVSTLILHILGCVAQFEIELNKERVLAGIKAAQSRGVKFGRKNTKPQYRDNVLELRSQGLSMRAIAKRIPISVGMIHQICNGK